MTNPHQTLGLPPSANAAAIRDRYLQLVREFPPERAPDKFAEIRAAYDQLRDPIESLKKRLFDVESPETFDAIIADLQPDIRSQRIPTQHLLALGKP